MNLRRAIGGPLLSIIFLAIFAYVIFGIQWFFNNSLQGQGKEALLADISAAPADKPIQETVLQNTTANAVQQIPASPELEVNTKAAISIETDLKDENKILFDKNSDTQLPIASLTKLITAAVVLDNYNLSDTWQVDEAADSQDPMKQDVKLGDVIPVESFLEIMLIESSNKSAYALSELVGEQKFVDLMNQKVKDLGLENTSFVDPTGLSPQDVSTARDLAKIAEYIIKNYPKIAEISKVKEMYVNGFGNALNTDQLLGEFPEIVCSKTGFTAEAKGCLLLVANNPQNKDYLVNVILGADDRFSEMKKLINWSNASCN